jgi:DNA ligase-1
MAAQLLTSDIPADPTGWWISEKYDGVRAIWTGSKLLTRNGKNLNPPAWFTTGLPHCRLDGELWMGRQSFDQLVSTIQRKDSDWSGVLYMVFDLADAGTFEDRQDSLHALRLHHPAYKVIHRPCFGAAELDAAELDIVDAGGEGLVIRRPGCLYRPGRIGDVVKVKRLVADVDRWQG